MSYRQNYFQKKKIDEKDSVCHIRKLRLGLGALRIQFDQLRYMHSKEREYQRKLKDEQNLAKTTYKSEYEAMLHYKENQEK